jgi:hypothetical protein
MNLKTSDRRKAIAEAKANAAYSGQCRYLHLWNGTYWQSKEPPLCEHIEVRPDGRVRDMNYSSR